ncbi:MAG: hypothetical protein EBW87_01705 [Burkholderiaceae bacterium]|nr:hypothetical protein [Burkholderiaceae bacterium]
MRLTKTFNTGYDNLYLNKDDVDRLLKGQMIKESTLIVQMEKPEREWVGLTDEDKESFWTADQMTQKEWDELFAAIETKLKEKNT